MQKWFAAFFVCACSFGAVSIGAVKILGADGAQPSSPLAKPVAASVVPASALGIKFVKDSTSTFTIERDGKSYVVDLAARTVRESGGASSPAPPNPREQIGRIRNPLPWHRSKPEDVQAEGTRVFKENCAKCHGVDGRGKAEVKTPNFTDPKTQTSLTDAQIIETIENGRKGTPMPAWKNELSASEITAVAAHIRSFGGEAGARQLEAQAAQTEQPNVYKPGDDLLFSLPTGRRRSRHGFYVNFTHRFAFDPAFKGTARGAALGGLDGLSLSSFGFAYGVTDKLNVSIFRSPSTIGRPIQLMAAYNYLDERDGQPLNAAVRFSVQGLNDFNREFTENIEGVFSRSLSRRAQIYFVPTVSFNDRRLVPVYNFPTRFIPAEPGFNALSLGVGAAVDIRPSVSLIVEVIPTVVNAEQLGIHRPAYSFGIQKKIWRHAFTLGLTNSPGVTVSQRAGTLASYLNDPTADKPVALVLGFNLTRQIF